MFEASKAEQDKRPFFILKLPPSQLKSQPNSRNFGSQQSYHRDSEQHAKLQKVQIQSILDIE